MWMALFGWITCSSLAYIYGCDKSSQEDFLYVNGREYPHKIILKDGHSSEIRRTIDGCICRALSGLVMEISLPVPLSTLERTVVWRYFLLFLLCSNWVLLLKKIDLHNPSFSVYFLSDYGGVLLGQHVSWDGKMNWQKKGSEESAT